MTLDDHAQRRIEIDRHLERCQFQEDAMSKSAWSSLWFTLAVAALSFYLGWQLGWASRAGFGSVVISLLD